MLISDIELLLQLHALLCLTLPCSLSHLKLPLFASITDFTLPSQSHPPLHPAYSLQDKGAERKHKMDQQRLAKLSQDDMVRRLLFVDAESRARPQCKVY